jgi:hypothetical protein
MEGEGVTNHGLDVSVNEVLLVHIFQGLRHLDRDGCRFRLRQNPVCDMLLKIAMLNELHRQVQVQGILEPAEKANEVSLILSSSSETCV